MKKLLLLLLCFFYPTFALALNPPVERAEDIIGCWERVDFSEEAQKQINEIEPWPIRYQWFCFEPDGTLYTHGSSTYSKQTSESLHEAFKVLPKDITYTILQKGIIKTEQKSAQQTLIWGGNFMGNPVFFDGKAFEKGTFIMSIFSQEKRKNIYYRYLRRIQ
jgi:hypothetical protein